MMTIAELDFSHFIEEFHFVHFESLDRSSLHPERRVTGLEGDGVRVCATTFSRGN